MQWGYRFVSGVLFLASVAGMAFALYLEHGQGEWCVVFGICCRDGICFIS